MSNGNLSASERRLIALLGIPSAGLSLCLVMLATYLPVLARRFTTSTTIIGALVGGEGLVAVLLPVWAGRLSDRTQTRLGRRLPFLIAAAPVAAVALAVAPLASSLPVMGVAVLFFYLGYFTYLSPYRALYPDLVSAAASGRAQGVQGLFTGVGMGLSLVFGGLLLEAWRPLPYFLAGAALLVATAVLVIRLRDHAWSAPSHGPALDHAQHGFWTLVRENPRIRRFAIGNALLTFALGGLKSFVVLWLTEGLGKNMRFTACAMVVVAAGTVIGALVSGKLADRYGVATVLSLSLTVFGVGLALGTFSSSVIVLGTAFPVIALAGGAAVALPYALLMDLAPAKSHGTVAGLFDVSSGVGTLLGPTLTGLAIDVLRPVFGATHGYGAMWPVLSLSVLASTVILPPTRAPQAPPPSPSSR